MKLILSFLFSAAIILGLGTTTFAAEDDDVQKALELIEKTNKEIDEKIEKAVKKADDLHAEYLQEIRKIEEGEKVVKLGKEKEKIISELELSKHDIKKQQDLQKKLAEIEEKRLAETQKIESKIAEINQEIEGVTVQLISAAEEDKDTKKIEEKLDKLKSKLNARSEKYQEKTQRFTKDLGKVITDIYDETLKMSAETIEKAAKKGVIAECSWKLVRFADRWVWIDPVRVVKFSR
ncbi:hypothetical protein ACFSFW_17830 [Fredinandcohnia salidurans]|uniref:Uncharacterized protein n=1 Tax=Fredinandcohnia salidurans TaxID=2595041 RepID=A0ABW4MVR8_9BACI